MGLEDRIKQQFPSLFITLLSVLIGLVFADLVSEARARMTLWPLNIDTLRTWGQVVAMGTNTLNCWVFLAYIGIARVRLSGGKVRRVELHIAHNGRVARAGFRNMDELAESLTAAIAQARADSGTSASPPSPP